MARTRIKMCGMTRAQDAAAAVVAGADSIGLIFAPSPRQVDIEAAQGIASAVPPPVARVGVFVDAGVDEIAQTVAAVGLTAVQLHGAETPEFCSAMPVPVIKVIRVGTDFSWEMAEPFRGHAAALLLDTYSADKAGGTATTFAWQDIGEAPGWAPMFLAGGLTPDNVAAAVRTLRPYAVDVSSGIESEPGIKSVDAMRRFAEAVADADSEGDR